MTQTKTEPTANDSSPNRRDQDSVTEEEVSIGSIAAIPERQYSSTDSMSCRICQSATDKSRLISPCLCKGTLRYVHRECLEHWLSRSGLTHCELCLHRFQTYTTLRYGCCESLWLWYRHPSNRGLLLSDALIYVVLSFICFMLTMICVLVLRFQYDRGSSLQETLASTAIVCFLLLVLIVYLTNIVVLAKDHLVPWYRWWRSSRRIRLSEITLEEPGSHSHLGTVV
ncbi:E3 ubiquitin-protein ligase MARCHF3 [Culex quinquefasciatus]|uniref:E3 ubiquitin-protein ligase MARCHF3 n=1 Tax=Culex quinquefasciatus TaxID=7176 RepID=UPI0018E332A9|nr:E3 ubiquitin-protein ligase MARCHF3 [Culex quinquefasciatus]XP_039451704.1 E3 ubiquitin-protein ligase MARCHF3-like [Culex pipiens pallens]